MGGTSTASSDTSNNTNSSATNNQTSNSTTNQNQNTAENSVTGQTSSTNPWAASMPAVTGLLGSLQPLISNSGLSTTSSNAIDKLQANATNGNPYADKISGITSNLLGGGGADNQSGAVNQNYQNYMKATQPLASNTNYNPYDTPGFRDAISTATADITNGVNGQFAAAGRDFSGANSQALGRGIMQGVAPTIAAQYNQNVNNQQGAAGAAYGAGNTTSGLLSGLNQQGLANQQQGIGNTGQALDAQNYGANQTLSLDQLRQSIPTQNLTNLTNIGTSLANLGKTSTGTQINSGTSNTNSTANTLASLLSNLTGTSNSTGKTNNSSTMSGAQQFGTIANGLTSLFGGTNSTAGNIASGVSKLFS